MVYYNINNTVNTLGLFCNNPQTDSPVRRRFPEFKAVN